MLTYNERSWAIDIISEINKWAGSRTIQIKRAGGEHTLPSSDGSLFPDVLLFGDLNQNLILQGWELKFPDTPISDTRYIENAITKATNLGLDSFLLWNVTVAQLYIKNGNHFEIYRTWNNLSHIQGRDQVYQSLAEISLVLIEIMQDLNQYLLTGIIKPATIIDSLSGDGIVNVLFQNVETYANALCDYSILNSHFEDEVVIWWLTVKSGYPNNSDMWKILASTNIVTLFNKFVFAHVLKRVNNAALQIDEIDASFSVIQGLDKFQQISRVSDYWNILSINLGEELLPSLAWRNFIDLNDYLKSIDVSLIDSSVITTLLNKLLLRSKRKVAGQFVTPINLAGLIARMVIEDPTGDMIDPCCGTGTFLKAVFDLKKEKNIIDPLVTTWGSDKYLFPLRLAAFSLSVPENQGKILKVFQRDIIDIVPGNNIVLLDPFNGEEVTFQIPRFQYVISNLPFVRQEDIDKTNPTIRNINNKISELTQEEIGLDSRSDLYAYLPFYIWSFIEDNGRLGIILSNAWLATEWSKNFFGLLTRFYKIESITSSGSGRWFKEAKVVTNIVILRKRIDLSIDKDQFIKFVTLKKNISELSSIENQKIVKASINTLTDSSNEWVKIKSYNSNDLALVDSLHIPLNALFADIYWLFDTAGRFIQLNEILEIERGERRGWDKLFFPNVSNNIECVYLKPVLMTSQSVNSLLVSYDRLAFCCEESKERLRELNHSGALQWIELFENLTNTKGKPLPTVLARPGTYWYSMKPNTLADLVTSMNPGDRLFFGRFNTPTFVNQRLIRLSEKEGGTDLNLIHALLNSITSLFFVEAIGFGRGEGVLDLSSTKLQENMKILNPLNISPDHRTRILTAFDLLLHREIYNLDLELEMLDRREFDYAVLNAFELTDIYENVKASLLTLYHIRTAVKTD